MPVVAIRETAAAELDNVREPFAPWASSQAYAPRVEDASKGQWRLAEGPVAPAEGSCPLRQGQKPSAHQSRSRPFLAVQLQCSAQKPAEAGAESRRPPLRLAATTFASEPAQTVLRRSRLRSWPH